MAFSTYPLIPGDREWVSQFIKRHWGSETVVAHGVIYHPHELPGFAAVQDEEIVGLVTYHIEGDACEIVTINSDRPFIGIGTALLDAVKWAARQAGCTRLWLVTTNDNMDALWFYQKRGFVLVTVHRHAVTEARKLKPDIPLYGLESIPIRDEIELEMILV